MSDADLARKHAAERFVNAAYELAQADEGRNRAVARVAKAATDTESAAQALAVGPHVKPLNSRAGETFEKKIVAFSALIEKRAPDLMPAVSEALVAYVFTPEAFKKKWNAIIRKLRQRLEDARRAQASREPSKSLSEKAARLKKKRKRK